jgi:hypothetical protein
MTLKRYRQPRADLTNQVFGKLTVLEWVGNSRWACQCECGKTSVVLTANLKRGNTASCGCVRNILSSRRNTTHGLSNTIGYKTWLGVRRRCRDPKFGSYKDYGAKGIDIWQPWHDSVELFVADVGQPPTPEHTLDRIDNAKGYEPGNVRWATPTEQGRNRTTCVRVQFQGMSFPSLSAFVEWLAPQVNVNGESIEREMQTQFRQASRIRNKTVSRSGQSPR